MVDVYRKFVMFEYLGLLHVVITLKFDMSDMSIRGI